MKQFEWLCREMEEALQDAEEPKTAEDRHLLRLRMRELYCRSMHFLKDLQKQIRDIGGV